MMSRVTARLEGSMLIVRVPMRFRRVGARLLGSHELADQGLLSRLLVSAPDSTAGCRLWREPGTENEVAIRRYGARLLAILETPLPLAAGKRNELAPRILLLTTDARRRWISFADHVEREIGPNMPLATVRALGNKLAQHAARLGVVLTLVEDVDATELPAEMLERGIVLAEHYAAEALRLAELGEVEPDLRLAEQLLIWLRTHWNEPLVSMPDMYQLGPPTVRDGKTARHVIGILEEHGWLSRIEGGAEIRGQRRRDVWRIVEVPAP